MLNICPRYTVLYNITYQSSSAGSPIHVTLIEIFATSQQMFVVWGVVRHQLWPLFWARAHGWGRRRIPVRLIGSKFQHVPTRIFAQQNHVLFCAETLLVDLLHTELMPGVPDFPFWQQWGGLGRICRRWLIRVHLFNVRISFRINLLHFVSGRFIHAHYNHITSGSALWMIHVST